MLFSEYSTYSKERPIISFEIFPPKTARGMENLHQVIKDLVELGPDYITVTYGAMGSTREKTLEIASLIKDSFGIDTACHLTCVGSSKTELDDILTRIYDAGIKNIVAIRGDPPSGESAFVPQENGYSYGSELVEHIRAYEAGRQMSGYFGIAVGGYPEKHLEAPDMETDIQNLKLKIQAGADIVKTQLFFNNSSYFDFIDKARLAGITVPIIPGLMPILSAKQIERITSMCGSSIPPDLKFKLDQARGDEGKVREIGISQCIAQAIELLDSGVPGLHFYVLNKSEHMKEIIQALGVGSFKGKMDKFAVTEN
jgi:methylenetetrahydrofolate reductase (NADPH)